jgi:hypothetical protein
MKKKAAKKDELPKISEREMKSIWIQGFWLEDDFPPLGYGGHYLTGPIFILAALIAIVSLFVWNIMPTTNFLLTLLMIPLTLIWIIPAWIAYLLMKRYHGLYRITKQGKPYAFYSRTIPKGLGVHRRMKKHDYFRTLAYQKAAAQPAKKG